MIVFYIISLVVFVGYVTAIVARYGVPTSISESYYLMPKKYGAPIFSAFCLLVALPLMIYWFDASPEQWRFLVFLACAPLIFVGVACEFKADLTSTVHFVSAIASAVFSQLWIVINTPLWPVSVGLLLLALVASVCVKGRDADGNRRSAWLFWMELAAFVSPYVVLMIM